MINWLLRTFTLILFTAAAGTAVAQTSNNPTTEGDKIILPVGSQGQHPTQVLPAKGSSKETVSQQFGQPESQTAAVGTPPISRWHYADFSVYFEGDVVIHSVRKHSPQSAQ